MARTGTTIENAVTKERFTFLATAQDTDGELLRVDLTVAPGGGIRMRHVHPRQEERWEITEGWARFRLGREEVLAGPGETAVAPPGTPHAFVNAGDEDLSMIVDSAIIQGAVHIGLAVVLGVSALPAWLETASAILLAAGSAFFVAGATANWLAGVGDHFAARSFGWKLLGVSSLGHLPGMAIVIVGVVAALG